jgi:hypothetical protein
MRRSNRPNSPTLQAHHIKNMTKKMTLKELGEMPVERALLHRTVFFRPAAEMGHKQRIDDVCDGGSFRGKQP